MATKFDFLSPGVNIREIDNSVLPADAISAGPILVGRSVKGPAMQPIRVRSYEDFVDVFGAPVLGSAGSNADIWRSGNLLGPQYAGIAAQAHLASETTPITFVRLLGDDRSLSPVTTLSPGWTLSGNTSDPATNSTAYGLFLINSGAMNANDAGVLGAVFYCNSGFLALTGTVAGTTSTLTSSAGVLINSIGSGREFKIAVYNASSTKLEEVAFDFNNSDNSKYIRNQFNTNPVLTNSTISSTTKTYWLGETFERFVEDKTTSGTSAGDVLGILLPLASGSSNWATHDEKHQLAQSGWVIAQDQGAPGDYNPVSSNQKLFRCVSLHGGDNPQKETMIGISNISMPVDTSINPFSSFNVEVLNVAGDILEEFRNVNLDPQSSNYIVKRIGNTSYTWNDTEKKYNVSGDEPNLSNYVRVELDGLVKPNAPNLPW